MYGFPVLSLDWRAGDPVRGLAQETARLLFSAVGRQRISSGFVVAR